MASILRFFFYTGPSNCEDPKPGPSTTAAEFDLEVFDSGSSCSLEDAWGLGCSPEHEISNKVILLQRLEYRSDDIFGAGVIRRIRKFPNST